MTTKPRLTRKDASRYLLERWGLSYTADTLAKLAWNGNGPLYSKAGRRVQYMRDDLDAWARPMITGKYRSTSEYPRPPELPPSTDPARTVDADGDGLGQQGNEGEGRQRRAPERRKRR